MAYSDSGDILRKQHNKKVTKKAIPTPSELKLRQMLRSRGIPIECDKAIRYSLSHSYVPDIILGRNLIVEVDGGVHSLQSKITPDRIRQRALEMMGYTVLRVTNNEVWKSPEKTVEKIVQKFYEVTGVESEKKVTNLKIRVNRTRRIYYKEVDKVISELSDCNELLDYNADYLKNKVDKIVNDFSGSPWAVESFLFTQFGMRLKKSNDGDFLDYKDAAATFRKITNLALEMYGDAGEISLKNQLLITAPNFLKNIIIRGAPNSQKRIVTISNEEDMLKNIEEFNNAFRPHGITVESEHVFVECCKIIKHDSETFGWLNNLCLQKKYNQNSNS